MIFQTGSGLYFVRLSDTTGTDNQVLPKSERDFDSLGFLSRPLKKSAAVVDSIQPVKISITLVIHSVDRTLQEMVGGAHPTNVQS